MPWCAVRGACGWQAGRIYYVAYMAMDHVTKCNSYCLGAWLTKGAFRCSHRHFCRGLWFRGDWLDWIWTICVCVWERERERERVTMILMLWNKRFRTPWLHACSYDRVNVEYDCQKSVHLTGMDYSYNRRPYGVQSLSDRTMVIHAWYRQIQSKHESRQKTGEGGREGEREREREREKAYKSSLLLTHQY